MAQLSRPYQIALVALGLFAAVWFVALRGHSPSTSGSGSSAAVSAPAPSAAVQAEKAAAPSSVYHGSAPGVEGLTRAIAKAHGAVAISQQNARQLEAKSAQASDATGPDTGASNAGSRSTPSAAQRSSTTSKSSPATPLAAAHKGAGAAGAAASASLPARQVVVEKELKQGDVVVLLFWNPQGADDLAVHRELQLLLAVHRRIQPLGKVPAVQRLLKAFGLALDKKIAVHEAPASQVASFGSITRGVQVYQTPTILIVNKRGQATTLSGLTDAYSIEQAVDEARHS
jgi:hypothetical protein